MIEKNKLEKNTIKLKKSKKKIIKKNEIFNLSFITIIFTCVFI